MLLLMGSSTSSPSTFWYPSYLTDVFNAHGLPLVFTMEYVFLSLFLS